VSNLPTPTFTGEVGRCFVLHYFDDLTNRTNITTMAAVVNFRPPGFPNLQARFCHAVSVQ